MRLVRPRLLALALCVALACPILLAPVAAHGFATPSAAWTINLSGWDRTSSPTIADVNGDGVPDVVFGHQDGKVRVVSGATGAELPGWPQSAVVAGPAAAIDSTPAVADLDGNGRKEIIVGTGSTWQGGHNGGIVVFNSNGTERCHFRTGDALNISTGGGPDGFSDGVYSSPAIGDINGDGHPDIVFGSFDHHVYGLDRNCNVILSYNVEDTIWSSPVLYDIDGDGRQEILIGSDQSVGGFDNWSGGEFRALKWSPWGAIELWRRQINDTIQSSAAIGDIDGDGRPEVVVGGGSFYGRSDGHRIYAWHADNGSSLPGWPVTTGGSTMSPPTLADVTGDGRPDVIDGSADGVVRVIRGNGSTVWAKHLSWDHTHGGAAVNSPIVADVNGDGHNDVIAGNDWGMFALDGRNGGEIEEMSTWLAHGASAAVGKFGAAGWKMITIGFDTPHHTTKVQAYNIATPGTTPPWPMFRRDAVHHAGPLGHLLAAGFCRGPVPKRTVSPKSSHGEWILGVDGSVYPINGAPHLGSARGRVQGGAVAIAATASGNGYYVLDGHGDIFRFGDAKSYGSMAGKHLNQPIIALAPTPSGRGYWLLGRDGGVFTFGDAQYHGSTGGRKLNKPIISMAPTKSGRGYWLLASDGGVFTFGDARYHGSTGGLKLAAPVISMATEPSGNGYWLVARDGGIFTFGVPFYGSLPGLGLCFHPAGMQMRSTLTGHGYYIVAANGRVFSFGDASGNGSAPPLNVMNYGVDLAVRP
jgi:hypothetical protein